MNFYLCHQQTRDKYPLQNTQSNTIGRSSQCTICIPISEISKQHSLIEAQNDQWFITDLNSSNGTFVNGKRLQPHQATLIQPGDRLRFYNQDFEFFGENPVPEAESAPQTKHVTGMVMAQNLKIAPGSEILIGRSKECQIYISSPLVSRHHARITVENETPFIFDLQSTNGVYINGQRISGKQPLQLNDAIQIADSRIIFKGLNQALESFDERNNIRFDAVNISKHTADGKQLLKEISFTVLPGEFVAILGGSGAGKSTTLDALNGFRPATAGHILVNGEDYYSNFPSYQPVLGYVPQSDIIHEKLTVAEALDYAAKLRLSHDLSAEERSEQVHKVMDKLGLSQRHNVPIENLSGGQKKRVSIGVELLSEPSLFFLDEPTSGLDPGTEREMMRLMRKLAEQGKTVFLITHAVGNLDYCHQILFLAMGGQVAYYGPPDEMIPYFQALDSKIETIADIYNFLADAEASQQCVAHFKSSAQYKKYVWERHQNLKKLTEAKQQEANKRTKPKASFLNQLTTFSGRYTQILLKDKKSLAIQLLQTPVIAILIMLAFNLDIFNSNDYAIQTMAPSLLFMLTCVAIWFGTSNAAQEIIKEMAIYKRERMVNLRILPYVLSKIGIQSIITLLQCLVLVAMVCPVFKIASHYWLEIFFTLWLAGFTGTMMGLAISALSVSREMAVVFVPLVLIPQIMFSGAITKIQDMNSAGEIVSVLMTSRWTYQTLGNITEMNAYLKAPEPPKLPPCPCPPPSTTHQALPGAENKKSPKESTPKEETPFNKSFDAPKSIGWAANGIMSLFLFFMTLLLLKRRDIH